MPAQGNLKPLMSTDAINALLAEVYPQLNDSFAFYRAVDVFPGGCTVRLTADGRHLRPGGTVSGPSLFTLADIGGYVCVLSHAGPASMSMSKTIRFFPSFRMRQWPSMIPASALRTKLMFRLVVTDRASGPACESTQT